MKETLLAFALGGSTACLGCASEPAPRSPTTATGVTAKQAPNDPARGLDESECKSLGQWLRAACENRPNERSARADGWCSNVLSGVESGSWLTADCRKHITYIDSTCFRSTTNVHNMMMCDESVARP